jgi:hypothetical protein
LTERVGNGIVVCSDKYKGGFFMGAYDSASPLSLTELMSALNEYPHEVSKGLLREHRFVSLLDAGCGTNDSLAKHVINRGARYIGMDSKSTKIADGKTIPNADLLRWKLRAEHRTTQTRCPFIISPTDIFKIQEDPTLVADIIHMRFVLMHIPQSQWENLLWKLRTRAKKIILIEYDWSTFSCSHRYKKYVEDFEKLSLRFMKGLGVDPYVGSKLKLLAEKISPQVTYQEHQRPEGSYLKDLLALSLMQKDLAAERGLKDFAEQFTIVQNAFEEFIRRGTPIPFTPPLICSTTIAL